MERVGRRWWTGSVTALAALVVMAASVSALFQLAVMAFPGYRDHIAAFVTRTAGRPVDIGGAGLGWRGLNPRLELSDITVYAPDGETPALSADRLSVGIGWSRLLHGELRPSLIDLEGLQLSAEIDRSGKLRLRGFDSAGPSKSSWDDWLQQAERFDQLGLADCELWLDDHRVSREPMALRLRSARLSRTRGGARLQGEFELPASEGTLAEVAAEVQGPILQPERWNGEWRLEIRDFNGMPWMGRKLPRDFQLEIADGRLRAEGAIREGSFGELGLRLTADRVEGRRGTQQALLSGLDVQAQGRSVANGWLLEFPRIRASGRDGGWPDGRAQLRLLMGHREAATFPKPADLAGIEAELDFVRAQDVMDWLGLFPLAWAQGLPHLRGDAHAVSLRLRRDAARAEPWTYALRAQLADFGIAGGQGKSAGMAIRGLNGQITATEAGGHLSATPSPLTLVLPSIFELPIALESFAVDLGWVRGTGDWQLSVPAFSAAMLGAQAAGTLEMALPRGGGRPRLDLSADFSVADAVLFKPYMPIVWGEGLRKWLDRAVLAGRVPQAHLRIDGDLSQFPFREGAGEFSLDLPVVDGRLAFQPEWPELEQLRAGLHFRNEKVTATGAAHLLGQGIENARLSLDDYRSPLLSAAGHVAGDVRDFYAVARQTPLSRMLAGLLEITEGSGPAALDLDLQIPVRSGAALRVGGVVHLDGAELAVRHLDAPIRDIRGDIAFGPEGMDSPAVEAQLYDRPVKASIMPLGLGDSVIDFGFPFQPQADGSGLSRYVPSLLRPYLHGQTDVRASLRVGRTIKPALNLESSLLGLEVALPEPLHKPADAAQPLRLSVALGEQGGTDVTLTMPDQLGARFLVPAQGGPTQGLVRLGDATPPVLRDPGMRLEGSVADADLQGWLDFLQHLPGPGRPQAQAGAAAEAGQAVVQTARQTLAAGPGGRYSGLAAADLQMASAHWENRYVRDVHAVYTPLSDGWRVQLDGSGAAGLLRWSDTDGTRLHADLEHLKSDARPLAARGPAQREDRQGEPVDPAQVPELDIDIASAHLGEVDLGRLRLATERATAGQRIVEATTRGGQLDMTATGAWHREQGHSRAELELKLETSQVGGLVQGLGYARNLDARHAQVQATLAWSPEPGGLDWTQAKGALAVAMNGGSLRAVEPGAGRVLGLFNFYALPRRIGLNFSDVLTRGLSFDELKGHFAVGQGVARTDDLDLRGPSVRMEVRGDVGLADRSYDQHITVYPGVTGGVTLGALLLGGPAVGALALLAQEVLDKPLDQATQFSYRVTGNWDHPQVQRD